MPADVSSMSSSDSSELEALEVLSISIVREALVIVFMGRRAERGRPGDLRLLPARCGVRTSL